MRRSARETKKPEVFTFSAGDGGDHIRHDETDEEDYGVSSQSTNRRLQKKQIISAAQGSASGVGRFKFLDTVSASRNITSEVGAWIDGYKEDKVTSMAALVNFILLSAGAEKEWVAYDVDLEALEPEELDVLLADMMKAMSESENSKDYPLTEKSKSKGAKSFRDKYRAFWIAWVERLLALPRERGGKRVLGHEILRTVVDQLVALSSMAVVNVRDAVAEAALSVSEAVLAACGALRTELETARRQIAAEENNRSKAQAQQNPRYLACVQQRDTVTKDLEALTELTSTVFNSVLLHRIQDFHDEVRATASRHLLDFVRFDLKRPIHVEYLKYLGRACSDHAAQVRMEAVCAIRELVEDVDVVPYLTEFVAVFMDRFVDIASRDIDDNVSLEMIETLRAMQKAGLLDSISEEKLDVVDLIVFDVEASARVRQEALAFLMDHTEGFDEDADEDAAAAVALDLSLASLTGKAAKSNKGKGSAEGKADQAKALARRQRTAQQLETLTEYAAHHLGERFDLSHMLAEACLALRKFGIVYNWSVAIALLLRETDDVITFSLLPAQAAILLRVFVHCATDLSAKRRALADATSLNAAEKQTVQWWEALNDSLQTHLPALLTRYKDDETGLAVLVDLLPCVDYASEERTCKAALKVALELVEITRDEAVLRKLAAALASWTRLGGVVGGSVAAAVRMLVRDAWTSTVDCSAQLQGFLNSSASSNSGAGKKGAAAKRKSKSSSQSEKDETVLGLQRSLMTLKVFWATMDCRRFLDENADAVIDELTEVSDRIPTFAEGEGTQLTPLLAEACIAAAQSTVDVINTTVLWSYKDVLDVGRRLATELNAPARRKPAAKKARSSASEVSDEAGGDDASSVQAEFERSVSVAVDTVVDQRKKLLGILLTWLQIGADQTEANDTQLTRVQRALRVKAYQVVSSLRNFFPERDAQYRYIDRLAFAPDAPVLHGVRRVFDSEGDRIKRQLSALRASGDPENEEAMAALSRSLIECVLEPVRKNLIYDVENMNRKQAASVLYYLIDSPHPMVEENIKGLMRQLKDSSLYKYMQMQWVTVTDLYRMIVGKPLEARLAAEEEAEAGETDFDFEGNDRVLQDGYAKLDVLVRKLAQSLGVGKLKDDAMDVLMPFLKACVNHAVADVNNAGLAGCLHNYLRFLQPVHQRDLHDHLVHAIESNPALADELTDQRERGHEEGQQGRHLGFAKLLEFLERLQGKSRPKMTSRRRPSNAPSQRDADYSMNLSPAAVGRASTASAATVGGKPGSQFASQALLDEDLELIGRGRKAGGGGKASQRPSEKPAGRGGPQPPAKGKPAAASKGRGKKRRAEESSEEEDSEEESGRDEDAESDGYEGLETDAKTRRYQQRFTQGLSATQPSQPQSPAQSQSQSRGAKRGAAKPGPARPAPAVVMGLDLEDISEDEENEGAVAGRSKRAKVGNGRTGTTAGRGKGRSSAGSRVSDEIEDEVEDVEAEEEAEEDRGGAAGGRKRSYSAVRGGSSAGSDTGATLAELDSVPSRRRLRQ